MRTVEHRGGYEDGAFDDLVGVVLVVPTPIGCPAQVVFKQLANIHTGRNTQRVQDNVDGSTIGQIRHVLDRQNAADDALVAMATRKLVALLYLTLLSYVHTHELVDSR